MFALSARRTAAALTKAQPKLPKTTVSRSVFATLLQKPKTLSMFDASEYDRAGLGRIEMVTPSNTARCITSGTAPLAAAKLTWPAKMTVNTHRMSAAVATVRTASSDAATPAANAKITVDLYGEDFNDGCWLP